MKAASPPRDGKQQDTDDVEHGAGHPVQLGPGSVQIVPQLGDQPVEFFGESSRRTGSSTTDRSHERPRNAVDPCKDSGGKRVELHPIGRKYSDQPDLDCEPKGRAPVHRLILVDHVQEDEDHHQSCSQHQKRADCRRDRPELGFRRGVEIAL